MVIKDLITDHPFIYYTAMLRYEELRGGNGKSEEVYSFPWNETREGVRIWGRVVEKNYVPFYEFHGRNTVTGLLDK